MSSRYDADAEQGVIGAVLRDERVINDFTLNAEDFHLPKHEQLWHLINQEHRVGNPITPIGISQRLIASPITGIDGDYLKDCIDKAPADNAVPHVADMLKALANLRRVARIGIKINADATTANWEDANQIIDNARSDLDQTANAATGIKTRTFSDALADAIEIWDNPRPRGIPTGWPELDELFNGGWRPGNLTVIGARPAVGKSLVAGTAAIAAAQHGVGFFSLEMLEEEVTARMSSAAQDIWLSKFNNSKLTDTDWKKVAQLAERSRSWPLFIESNSQMSMAQIRATVRTWQRKHPVPLVIIDYLQLVQPADRNESRERQVARVAEDCKHLAKEFDTHVIALAQVNRNSTQGETRPPRVSDLRESGGIEAFADNIILLHREHDNSDMITFIVGKNRHGKTENIDLVWRPHVASVSSPAQNIPNHESFIA
jgi:replicative DNA helicase